MPCAASQELLGHGHLELPQYSTYSALKAFALKYVKVMQGISAARKRTRPAHVVEEIWEGETEDSAAEEDDLRQRLNETEDPAEQIEILAFMRARGMSPAGRGVAGRFQRAPGGRGQGVPERPRMAPFGRPAQREVPPRGRADMSCINCGRNGHAASECRQAKVEKGDRPCFTCGKTGHEART